MLLLLPIVGDILVFEYGGSFYELSYSDLEFSLIYLDVFRLRFFYYVNLLPRDEFRLRPFY